MLGKRLSLRFGVTHKTFNVHQEIWNIAFQTKCKIYIYFSLSADLDAMQCETLHPMHTAV